MKKAISREISNNPFKWQIQTNSKKEKYCQKFNKVINDERFNLYCDIT